MSVGFTAVHEFAPHGLLTTGLRFLTEPTLALGWGLGLVELGWLRGWRAKAVWMIVLVTFIACVEFVVLPYVIGQFLPPPVD